MIASYSNKWETPYTGGSWIGASSVIPIIWTNSYDKPNKQEVAEKWTEGLREGSFALLSGLDQHLMAVNRKVATAEDYQRVVNLDNKIVYSTIADKYYRIRVGTSTTKNYVDDINKNDTNDLRLFYAMDAAAHNMNEAVPGGVKRDLDDKVYFVKYDLSTVAISLTEEPGPSQHTATLNADHYQLEDAPYSMFAMPFDEANLDLAVDIAKQLTAGQGGKIYDIQIVPYCPCRYLLQEDSTFDLTEGNIDKA